MKKRFKKTFVLLMILALFCSACSAEKNNEADSQEISSQVSDHTGLSENDITVSEGTVSEGTISGDGTGNHYEGEWYRTDVESYQWARIVISDWIEGESFEVTLDAMYSDYSGTVEGKAVFIEEDTAVLYDENVEELFHDQEGHDREGDHGIYFQFLDDSIVVTHDSSIRMMFGGGGIATAEGTYIQGEPEYTNCSDVNDIFTLAELEQIQELLGEQYDLLFKNRIELGEIEKYASDGVRMWEAYSMPNAADWCDIVIYDDGRIYIEGYDRSMESEEFYTNSGDAKMPDVETLKSEENRLESAERSPQSKIMDGNLSDIDDTEEFTEYMVRSFQNWKENGTMEKLEWRQIDLNGDGIDDLILQECETIGPTQIHRITAIFSCEEDSADCVLWDVNDYSEFSFCGPTGELMYTAPYSGTAIAGEPYRHYYYDSEWNEIRDYWLDRTTVDSSMDGSREEFLQLNPGFVEAHPDMLEDGEYYSRYEIDPKTGESGEREVLSYEQFREIFKDVMGMEFVKLNP